MLDPDITTLALFKGACRREIDEPAGPRGGQSKTVLKAIIVGRERAYITACFPVSSRYPNNPIVRTPALD